MKSLGHAQDLVNWRMLFRQCTEECVKKTNIKSKITNIVYCIEDVHLNGIVE